MSETFRVMMTDDERKRRRQGEPASHPDWVPWDLLVPHRGQAKTNHDGQTIERLKERGGLSVKELYCVLKDIRRGDCPTDVSEAQMGRFLFDERVRYTDGLAQRNKEEEERQCRPC